MKSYDRLSERQRNILRYMEQYIEANGFPPTIREIGLAVDINSTSVVNYNLNKLVAAGYLTRSGRVSRGLRMVKNLPSGDPKTVKTSATSTRVPLYGQIVAGKPIPKPEDTGHHAEDSVTVSPDLLGSVDPAQVFALRVKGESMIDANIQEGDIVLLRAQPDVPNGAMAAVWLTGRNETTLKFVHREGDQIRLQPANPYMDPIYVAANECQVQGRVLAVIRKLA